MPGYFSLVLHAHLPFVRHPEHDRFLEENWLFEAITETYVPLLRLLEAWRRDRLPARLTLTLTPTLCSMLNDVLLRQRYERHLDELIQLTEKEVVRTKWETAFHQLAQFYRDQLKTVRAYYQECEGDLVRKFREAQDAGQIEIITSAATHALLALLADYPLSIRAQLLTARDHYQSCFGRNPRGIWLPECAYAPALDEPLREAGLEWFILDTHGVLFAEPKPRYGTLAPILTRQGLAAFGRDATSAKQVWSRDEGYPGDPIYREFYRDIGFDLDLGYLKDHFPAAGQRGFTGIKYYRITGGPAAKQVYHRAAAMKKAAEHAESFLAARAEQLAKIAPMMDRPPLIVAPYDAELFGHWWYEGPEFLDQLVRKSSARGDLFEWVTPGQYLSLCPVNQVAAPGASSWGEEGYWRVWLNEKNEWIYPHLHTAQTRMTELARKFSEPNPLQERALKQTARELLLAQSSDWPFILRTGTSPEYARTRFTDHILRFTALYDGLKNGIVNEAALHESEERDNLFPEIDFRHWR